MNSEEIFYAADRERIKGRQMLPSDTLAYIKALEIIADVAWELHRTVGQPYEKQRVKADELYDALVRVNFLLDAEDE